DLTGEVGRSLGRAAEVALGGVAGQAVVVLGRQVDGAVAAGVVVALPVVAAAAAGDLLVGVGEVVAGGAEVAEALVPVVLERRVGRAVARRGLVVDVDAVVGVGVIEVVVGRRREGDRAEQELLQELAVIAAIGVDRGGLDLLPVRIIRRVAGGEVVRQSVDLGEVDPNQLVGRSRLAGAPADEHARLVPLLVLAGGVVAGDLADQVGAADLAVGRLQRGRVGADAHRQLAGDRGVELVVEKERGLDVRREILRRQGVERADVGAQIVDEHLAQRLTAVGDARLAVDEAAVELVDVGLRAAVGVLAAAVGIVAAAGVGHRVVVVVVVAAG